VTRAVAVLEILARSASPLGPTEIARRLGLAKSSVANLCTALEAAGMVQRDHGGWSLGYKVVELGQAFLSGTDLVTEFRRHTADLPAAAQETVLLAVLDDLDVLYIARHDGTQPIRLASDVGRRLPAVVTGLGKAMLAQLPPDELDARLSRVTELPRLTARAHTSLASLREDLDRIRRRGYAIDDQQNTDGVVCYGVALPHPTGAHTAGTRTAVSVTLLAARDNDELSAGLVADLRQLASHLARTTAW
jgi:DNA-binding IclR family transcriptional regulator